jgi:hypothetical protein
VGGRKEIRMDGRKMKDYGRTGTRKGTRICIGRMLKKAAVYIIRRTEEQEGNK